MNRTNSTPLRVGIVGAGLVTTGSHLPILASLPDVRVAWIADRSAAAAQKAAAMVAGAAHYTDAAAAPTVDAVLVATPVGARRAIVPGLLARGMHVLCEKPFALSLAEHDEYLRLAAAHGVQLGVGQVRRYAAATCTARRLLAEGFLGPVVGVGAAEGMVVRGTGRGGDWHMTDPANGGGVLWETGSHLVDQLMYVLDVRDVTLEESRQVRRRGIELASSVEATLTRANGERVRAVVELSSVDDLCNGIFIEFERCVLKIGFFFGEPLALLARDGTQLVELVPDEGVQDPSQAFALEWRDFLDQCRTGTPTRIDAATVRCTTKLIASAYEHAVVETGEVAA